jgi:hypothetical protein
MSISRAKKANAEKIEVSVEKEKINIETSKEIIKNVVVNVEETKVIADPDAPIRWKKIGGGSSHLMINGKNKMVKPNQEFTARPSEISLMFRDVIVSLETIPAPEQIAPTPGIKSVYALRALNIEEENSLFDIVDQNGKKINEKPLPKEIAESLINDLQK